MGEDIHDDQGYLAAPEPIDMNAGGVTDKDIQDFLAYRDRLNAAKNSGRDRVTTASNSPSADRLTAASRGVIDLTSDSNAMMDSVGDSLIPSRARRIDPTHQDNDGQRQAPNDSVFGTDTSLSSESSVTYAPGARVNSSSDNRLTCSSSGALFSDSNTDETPKDIFTSSRRVIDTAAEYDRQATRVRHVSPKAKPKGRTKAKVPRGRNILLTNYQPKQKRRENTGAGPPTQHQNTRFEMTMPATHPSFRTETAFGRPPMATGQRQLWTPSEAQPRARLNQQRQEAQRRHGRSGPLSGHQQQSSHQQRREAQGRHDRNGPFMSKNTSQSRTTGMPGTNQARGTRNPRDRRQTNARSGHKERFVIPSTMCLVYKDELRQQCPKLNIRSERFGDYQVARLPKRTPCSHIRRHRHDDEWASLDCDKFRISFCTACNKEGKTNALCYNHLECHFHGYFYSIPNNYMGVWRYGGCFPRIERLKHTEGFSMYNLRKLHRSKKQDWYEEMREAGYDEPWKTTWVCAFEDDPTNTKIFWRSILEDPDLLLLPNFHNRGDAKVSRDIEYDAIFAMSTYNKDRCIRNHHRMQCWMQDAKHRQLPQDMIVKIFAFIQPTPEHKDAISGHRHNHFILPSTARLERSIQLMLRRYDN